MRSNKFIVGLLKIIVVLAVIEYLVMQFLASSGQVQLGWTTIFLDSVILSSFSAVVLYAIVPKRRKLEPANQAQLKPGTFSTRFISFSLFAVKTMMIVFLVEPYLP